MLNILMAQEGGWCMACGVWGGMSGGVEEIWLGAEVFDGEGVERVGVVCGGEDEQRGGCLSSEQSSLKG